MAYKNGKQFDKPNEIARIARIEAVLRVEAKTSLALRSTTELEACATALYVKHLHATHKIYLAEWQENSRGRYLAAYRWRTSEDQADCIKPPREAPGESQRRFRERQKSAAALKAFEDEKTQSNQAALPRTSPCDVHRQFWGQK